jgi:hypothetical protein
MKLKPQGREGNPTPEVKKLNPNNKVDSFVEKWANLGPLLICRYTFFICNKIM